VRLCDNLLANLGGLADSILTAGGAFRLLPAELSFTSYLRNFPSPGRLLPVSWPHSVLHAELSFTWSAVARLLAALRVTCGTFLHLVGCCPSPGRTPCYMRNFPSPGRLLPVSWPHSVLHAELSFTWSAVARPLAALRVTCGTFLHLVGCCPSLAALRVTCGTFLHLVGCCPSPGRTPCCLKGLFLWRPHHQPRKEPLRPALENLMGIEIWPPYVFRW
jgi:hypothetical protein